MKTLSRQMADFITSDISGQITPEVCQTVQLAFLDTAGCILSGRDEEVTRLFATWANRRYLNMQEADVFFSGQKHTAMVAAMLNAVSGHALDFDDVALAGHPSVVLVPVLLAESDRNGLAGQALVSAYLKGYEIWADLLNRIPDPLHEKGWHPTAVLGTMGATAALCAARQIDSEKTTHALGIAASRASGLVANFGSMCKPLHAGWAIEYAYGAVEMAAMGVTASADALEGSTGFLTAFSDRHAPDRERPFEKQQALSINTVKPSIKKYPVCYASHRVIDGVLQLRQQHNIPIEHIQTITATVSETNARVLKYQHPGTPLQAKFSMPFACASALVYGEVSLQKMTEDDITNPAIRTLMEKVKVSINNEACPLEPSFSLHDDVTITLKDNTRLESGPIRFALGHAHFPLAPAQLEAKILSCVKPAERESTMALIAKLNNHFTAMAI